jgi:glutamine synthetase
MLRVPWVRPEVDRDQKGGLNLSLARLECRAADTAMNPYLAAAMVLAAGLEGIEKKIDPGNPIPLNMYTQSDEQLEALKVKVLPRTLLEAVESFEVDPLSVQVMGSELAKSFAQAKASEWWSYHNTVSKWEYDEYLEKF